MGSLICERSIRLGMSDRDTIIAYWLLPALDHAARFQRVVDKLADQQCGVRFLPHLSFGSFLDNKPDLSGVLQLLCGLELRPTEVAETASFTMSLFVRFEPTEQLLQARCALEACPGFRTSRDFDPHISLCYGAPVNKGAIQREINALLDQPVLFDRLVATEISLPVESYDDIKLWQQRAEYPIESVS